MYRHAILCLLLTLALAATAPLSVFASPVTDADAAQIVQQALNIKSLQPYFHLEVNPQHAFVVVVGKMPRSAKVTKFGHPVVFRRQANLHGTDKSYLFLKNLSIHGNDAFIQFAYPAQGIQLTARLKKNAQQQWTVTNHTLIEQ